MVTEFEEYIDSPDADAEFAAWLVEQAEDNPGHPMFTAARSVWEQSDEASDKAHDWSRDRGWDRRLHEAGL